MKYNKPTNSGLSLSRSKKIMWINANEQGHNPDNSKGRLYYRDWEKSPSRGRDI